MYQNSFRVLFVVAVSALLYIFLDHPTALTLGGWQSPILLLFLTLTLGIYWVIASRFRKTITTPLVVVLGYVMGLLWVCEILVGNLNLHPSPLILNLFYRGPIMLVVLTNVVIGFIATHRQKHFLAGMVGGVQSGIISGLLAIITLAGLLIFTLPIQLADVQNIREFSSSGGTDFPAFLVQGYSFAGLNHLWIGILGGLIFGSTGSLVALPLKKIKPMSHTGN